MKIVDVFELKKNGEVGVRHMSYGQVGYVTNSAISQNLGKLVLRTFNGIVNLEKPNETWPEDCTMRITPLPVGSQILLEVTN